MLRQKQVIIFPRSGASGGISMQFYLNKHYMV